MREDIITFAEAALEPVKPLVHARRGINHLAFSPDGAALASSDVLMSVRVVGDGAVRLERSFAVRQEKVRSTQRIRGLAFSGDGSILYVAAADTLHALDAFAGTDLWSYTPPRAWAFLIVSPIALASSGDLLASAFDNGSLGVWKSSGERLALFHDNDAPRSLSFLSEDQLVGTDSFSLSVWNWRERKQVFKAKLPSRCYGFAASTAHRLIATRSLHHVYVWDLESRVPRAQIETDMGLPVMEWHPTEPLLAIAERHRVRLCTLDGESVAEKQVEAAAILSLTLRPDGKELAIGCSDNEVRHWRF